MIKVFVCEDREEQRQQLEKLIKGYISMEDLDMSVVLATADPYEVLSYVEKNKVTDSLYFLDIDLQTNITGIQLGAKIREHDKRGMIAFVTAEKSAHRLIMDHYVEAIGCVEKTDAMEQGIRECIVKAQERLLLNEEKRFQFKVGRDVRSKPYNEILYFEKSPDNKNKIRIITTTGDADFLGALKDIAKEHKSFYQADGSYVFNMDNMTGFERNSGKVTLINDVICYIAVKKRKDFERMMIYRR